jgi:hypothetical protein
MGNLCSDGDVPLRYPAPVTNLLIHATRHRRAPKAILDEKETGMAHREQHGNREAKKVKKEKPKGEVGAQSTRWAVSEIVEARTGSKH